MSVNTNWWQKTQRPDDAPMVGVIKNGGKGTTPKNGRRQVRPIVTEVTLHTEKYAKYDPLTVALRESGFIE